MNSRGKREKDEMKGLRERERQSEHEGVRRQRRGEKQDARKNVNKRRWTKYKGEEKTHNLGTGKIRRE